MLGFWFSFWINFAHPCRYYIPFFFLILLFLPSSLSHSLLRTHLVFVWFCVIIDQCWLRFCVWMQMNTLMKRLVWFAVVIISFVGALACVGQTMLETDIWKVVEEIQFIKAAKDPSTFLLVCASVGITVIININWRWIRKFIWKNIFLKK